MGLNTRRWDRVSDQTVVYRDPSGSRATTKGVPGPSWHRRARRVRSKLRRRVHLHRARGLLPRRRDLLHLSSHHSAPLYREVAFMGKRQQPWRGGGGYSSYQYTQYQPAAWQLWRESWSPRGRRPADSHYDAYSAEDWPHPAERPSEKQTADTENSAKLRAVQQALTKAKKADQRIRKIAEEETKRAELWQQYMKDTQMQFLIEAQKAARGGHGPIEGRGRACPRTTHKLQLWSRTLCSCRQRPLPKAMLSRCPIRIGTE